MQRASTRSGRISFVAIAGVLSLALVALLLFSNGQSPRSAAAEFMSALASGDVDKLTELSIVQTKGKDEIHNEWADAVKYGRSYIFAWNIVNVRQEKDSATVALEVIQNPQSGAAYPEKRELQLVRAGGGWKVDVTQISREVFPYLPQ